MALNESGRVMRLVEPKRKGIIDLIFSRLLVIVLLIVLQILLLIGNYRWFSEYIPYFAVLQSLFTLVMFFYLYNCGMDASAKLTWMLVLAVLPVPGALFLAYTRTSLGHRLIKSRTAKMIQQTRGAIAQDEAVLEALADDGSGTEDLYHYINRAGCMPVFANTEVTYFPLGEDKYAAMLHALEEAKRFILMEYFIIEEGEMWGRILEILRRKAEEGVTVRVMYDGMCEVSLLPHDYPKRLKEIGVEAKAFSPITAFVSTHYNYRDHRKILVIDNEVAFTGGVNLADEYINRRERFGHWKDTAVMLRGEAVRSFTLMFLQMWNVRESAPDFSLVDSPGISVPAEGYVMPYSDCPLMESKVARNVYMDILNRADRYVHIMTPYLILDGELETALKYAAERGIDVKLILPGIPDKKLAYALAKSHYKSLVSSGVKLYEYIPGFVHAKVFVCDDVKAVVGTINLDYRSLYHHFECAAYLYKVPCIADMERDFDEMLGKCRAVTPETIRKEKLSYKLMGIIMKAAAPLM